MDDRYRDDVPRRSVRLAGSNGGGAHSDRPPLPLGVNERTRGVGSRPTNGSPSGGATANGSGRRSMRPEFRPPAQPGTGGTPVYRGPRPGRPAGSTGRPERTAGRGAPAGRQACAGGPRAPRGSQGQAPRRQRPLNGSCAHTPSRPRPGIPRGGYPGGPYRGHRGSGRIFSRPTWQSLLFSPRGIALMLALVVIGVGGFSIHNAIQRGKAEEAARIEAKKEKERLAKQTVSPAKLGVTALPASTPKSEWQAGKMPHLYQTDPVWANRPYAGSDVRTAACGPTSLTMVYVYLTGKTDLDPASMAAFADEHNFAPTGATEWRFMTEGASMIGIRSSSVSPDRASVTSALKSDKPIICSVYAGDFTSIGHFIVLKSIDERGMVEVHDPNSPFNSAKLWPVDRILAQADALWCFSL